MRTVAMILLLSAVGCGSTTAPVIEGECRLGGPIGNMEVNGAKVDSSLVLEYTLCPV